MPSRHNNNKFQNNGNLQQVFGGAMDLLLHLTRAEGTTFLLEDGKGVLQPHLSRGLLRDAIGCLNFDLLLRSFSGRMKGKGTAHSGKGTLIHKGERMVVYFLGLPVTLRGQEIGILIATTTYSDGFNREDECIFSHVVVHLERVVQTTEPGEYQFFLDNSLVLPDLPVPVQNLKFSLDLRELLLSVADLIAEAVDYDVCLLFLPEASRELLRCEVLRLSIPEVELRLRSHYPSSAHIFPLVYKKGKPLLIGDVSKDRRFDGFDDLRSIISSLMAAPVIVKGENMGVLLVGSRETGNYVRDDLNTLCAFASQVGVLSELAADANFWEGYQRHIIESVLAAVISIDLQGYITIYNGGAKRLLGIAENEVKGCHYSELLKRIGNYSNIEGIISELKERIKRALKTGESYFKWDLHVACRQGRDVFVNLSLSPIRDSRQRILGVTAVIEDVTEKRQLEISLQEADKLAALGELAAGVAHEMRNPLTTIKGFTQLMQQYNYSVEELVTYTRIMLAEIDRMGEIIRSLLLLTNSTRVEVEPIDLNKLVESLLPLLQAEAMLQDVEILFQPAEDLPAAKADLSDLKQAILNIANNALQAMPYGGALTISTGYRVQEEEVWIKITDTGCGIDHEVYSHIFNPFFSTKEEGTGLGLPIAYQLAQKHGGEILVQSTVGEGTTFTIKLPFKKQS